MFVLLDLCEPAILAGWAPRPLPHGLLRTPSPLRERDALRCDVCKVRGLTIGWRRNEVARQIMPSLTSHEAFHHGPVDVDERLDIRSIAQNFAGITRHPKRQ